MTTAVWLCLAVTLTLLRRGRREPSQRRPDDVVARSGRHGRPGSSLRSGAVVPSAAVAGTAAGWALGAPLWAAGAFAVVAVFVVRTVGQRDARVTAPSPRAVALLLDLVAGALAAGSPTDQALLSVSEAARAVAGDDVAPKGSGGENDLVRAAAPLHQTGAVIRLGAPPSKAWNALAAHPGYADAGHAGRRCATSGARLAAALQAAARNERSRGALAAKLRAERLGGWLLLPLGLCFLPAFVCLGVVPVLVGIGQTALSGTGHAS